MIGAAIVLAAYLLFGGRTYCSWVCPVNPASDLAAWLRRRLGITFTAKIRPELRLYFGGAVLAAWRLARDRDLVGRDERVLLFNCANGNKYPLPDRSKLLKLAEAEPQAL